MSTPRTEPPGTEAAARVADVLLMFAGGPRRLGVTAIGRELGVSKAVVHRIIQSLVSRGMLDTDPGVPGYRLGPAAVMLGASALRHFDARAAATPVLRALRDETTETTTLSTLVNGARVYVEQFESPQVIKMTVDVGRRFPLYAGASSKAILAHLPVEQQEAVVTAHREPLLDRGEESAEELRAELAEIAASGTAVSLGERQAGAASVAAPLLRPDGTVHGAISVCGPVDRFPIARCTDYRKLVKEAAERINGSLAWLSDNPNA